MRIPNGSQKNIKILKKINNTVDITTLLNGKQSQI